MQEGFWAEMSVSGSDISHVVLPSFDAGYVIWAGVEAVSSCSPSAEKSVGDRGVGASGLSIVLADCRGVVAE